MRRRSKRKNQFEWVMCKAVIEDLRNGKVVLVENDEAKNNIALNEKILKLCVEALPVIDVNDPFELRKWKNYYYTAKGQVADELDNDFERFLNQYEAKHGTVNICEGYLRYCIVKCYAAKEWEELESLVNDMLLIFPTAKSARYYQACAKIRRCIDNKDYGHIKELRDKAVAISPNRLEAKELFFEAGMNYHIDNNNYKSAQSFASKIIEINPGNEMAQLNYHLTGAYYNIDQKAYQVALAHAHCALEANPDKQEIKVVACIADANYCMTQRDYVGVQLACQLGLKIDPENIELLAVQKQLPPMPPIVDKPLNFGDQDALCVFNGGDSRGLARVCSLEVAKNTCGASAASDGVMPRLSANNSTVFKECRTSVTPLAFDGKNLSFKCDILRELSL